MLEKKLPVFNIERFAIHDGNGIRTTVFLQGCPLRCLWCANPESQRIGNKIMHIKKRCTGCGRCAESCPKKCISICAGIATIQRPVCDACGKCTEVCLNNAMNLSGKMMSLEEIFEVVIKDKNYYDESDGGITFSGGEPLIHIEELVPLLKKLKEEKINIAFETCGAVPRAAFETALNFADCFLFDIKSLDEKKLAHYTDGDLEIILSNFEYVSNLNPEKVIARVPVIPGFNDSPDEIISIMKYVKNQKISEIHFLPYHTLGVSKYEQLDKEYFMKNKAALKKDELTKYVPIGAELGLMVKIGG